MPYGNSWRGIFALASLVGVSAVGPLLAPEQAWAQDDATPSSDPAAEARRRYNLGTQAYTTKRFVEAALNFEAAAYQRPHAVTLYTAALAWEQAGQTERAADDFARALEVSGLSTQQSTNARDRLATYEAMLGTVVVTGSEGSRVQLDAFTEVGTPARLHGTAGVHSMAVRVRGRGVERRDVLLEAGLTQKVDVDTASAPPSAVAIAKDAPKAAAVVVAPVPLASTTGDAAVDVGPPRANDLRRTLGFVAVGVGGASALAGVVFGTQALSARDAYNAAPSRAGFDHANALATWTTLSFIAGGALVAGGATLVLWPSSSASTARAKLTVTPTLGGALVGGAF